MAAVGGDQDGIRRRPLVDIGDRVVGAQAAAAALGAQARIRRHAGQRLRRLVQHEVDAAERQGRRRDGGGAGQHREAAAIALGAYPERAEAELSAQDIEELGIGAGLSEGSIGLRLRYQLSPLFAPYVGVEYERAFGRAQASGRLHQRVEHGLQIEGRAADELEHVCGRGMLLQRLAKLVEEACVLNRDNRLGGEILH